MFFGDFSSQKSRFWLKKVPKMVLFHQNCILDKNWTFGTVCEAGAFYCFVFLLLLMYFEKKYSFFLEIISDFRVFSKLFTFLPFCSLGSYLSLGITHCLNRVLRFTVASKSCYIHTGCVGWSNFWKCKQKVVGFES